MNQSVISAEYLEKQQKMMELQRNWENRLQSSGFQVPVDTKLEPTIPIISQIDIEVEASVYQEVVLDLIDLLQEENPELTPQLKKIQTYLTESEASHWAPEALKLNTFYFDNLSDRLEVEEWIPSYLAEQAIRPFLRVIAKQNQDQFTVINTKGVCPCCGEPSRLALLGEHGEKIIYCPRCYANWQDKRMACSHCGSEQEEDLRYLSVEGEDKAQIHICHSCNGYLKVIDTREMLDKPRPDLLDLDTIHLDIIAQDRGYGELRTKTQQS